MTTVYTTTMPLVLLCVSLNTLAQILMKKGLFKVGEISLEWSTLLDTGFKIITNPLIMGGIGCFVVSLGLWLTILSRVELSMAYPLTSIGYILTAILGYWLLGEGVSLTRMGGIVVIMIGVYLVSRS